jgi:hypothetical protein
MCKSQSTADVRAQHEMRERRKITKSVKEICTHLNLQPSSPLIASESEESPEIESFDEIIARFDEKKLQCSSGTVMRALTVLTLTMVAWLEHPHLTLLRQIQKMLKKAKTTIMSEASRRHS